METGSGAGPCVVQAGSEPGRRGRTGDRGEGKYTHITDFCSKSVGGGRGRRRVVTRRCDTKYG